jgi:D-arabinose 5-phosphate isomerase GutQ
MLIGKDKLIAEKIMFSLNRVHKEFYFLSPNEGTESSPPPINPPPLR